MTNMRGANTIAAETIPFPEIAAGSIRRVGRRSARAETMESLSNRGACGEPIPTLENPCAF
jgi:hypothetical protein